MTEYLYDPDLEVSSLFSRAWETFKEHFWPTVGVFVIYSLLTSAGGIWGDDIGIGELLVFIISGPITAGTYMYALRLIRGGDSDLGEMLRGFQVFGKAFVVFALYSVMVIVGLIFLIVPGVYVAVALMPAMFLVLDDDLGAVDTLRKAWEMTTGHRRQLFIVLLAIVGLNLLGLVALLIGVVFTGALSLLIGAAVYDELARVYEANHAMEPAS